MRMLSKWKFKFILGLSFIFLIGFAFNAIATNNLVKDKSPVLTIEEVEAFYKDYAEAWQNQDYDSIKRNSIVVTGEETIAHHKRLYSEGVYLLSAQVNSLEKITVNELNKRIEDKLSKLSNEEWVIKDVPIEDVPMEVRNADKNMPREELVVNEERIKAYKSMENQIAQEGSIYVANVTLNFTDETIVDDEQKFVFHDGQWKVYVR
ncbi:MAG: hypothetical protein CVU90_10255 [Firmicutes bacterium HGW-Firmicutes-15]|nr:MAG: hypothetical protein CVU90_10255 [Firmicutes bacterium HGW-Firmicutes-15]